MAITRSSITTSEDEPPALCSACGHRCARLAKLVGVDGQVVGTTTVCSSCVPSHQAPGE